MEILLMIIHIIAFIVLVICLIALGWYLHILKEQKQEKGGYITLDGDVEASTFKKGDILESLYNDLQKLM